MFGNVTFYFLFLVKNLRQIRRLNAIKQEMKIVMIRERNEKWVLIQFTIAYSLRNYLKHRRKSREQLNFCNRFI